MIGTPIGRYMYAIMQPPEPRRKTYALNLFATHGGALLGTVSWCVKWRQYEFCPAPNTGFSADCLSDLAEFVTNLTTEKRGEG